MYTIYKITSNPVVDFSAEELKKYLRMMMPRCGEIAIAYKPDATDGFRLGLMEDFGLDTSEAKDQKLDDILHIDTDCNGGIIAGNNYRSILQAVYKYLTLNGCRWLFPGVDGEFIPIRNIEPTKYHKMADCRYRGQCNEGAESQQAMLETIDFSPKIGLNVYMLEFDIPKIYYDWYYDHKNNTANREKEPVTADTVLQWKRACEAEIAKRGLQFHDMGHGWNAEAFGISSVGGWTKDANNHIPEETRKYLAEINGVRGLFKDVALNTNFCMSNPEARKIVVDAVAKYAEENRHVGVLHVWLADGQRNHCECEVCRTKTPSDWYVVLMNDIDAELTRRGIDNRIGICVYSDTAYEPTCEHINNPDRFTIILGAITRSYTYSVPKDPVVEKLTPFVLNKSGRLETQEEYIVRLKLWKNFVPSSCVSYEYHFWKPQFYAPGVLSFAKRLYEDVRSYVDNGFEGLIEDGSQRSFFPNSFSFYTYAATLFDNDLDFEELKKDYFQHAYGDQWETVLKYLETIDELMPHSYMEAIHTAKKPNSFYNPAMEEKLLAVEEATRKFDEQFMEHRNMPYRVQTVAMRLLTEHTEFCRRLAKAMALKCLGKDDEAKELATELLFKDFGKRELAMERYYDHMMMVHAMNGIFNTKSAAEYAQ